jgi:hypothetical protein
MFETRVLRRIFGPARKEVTGSGADCITRNFMVCTYHVIFGLPNQGERDRWAYGAYRRQEKCILGFGDETCRICGDGKRILQ